MNERRRYAAMVVLFIVGFGMVALASALDAYWPLFVTPLPYAVIPWMIARARAREAQSSASS